jgi:hypothetical protein
MPATRMLAYGGTTWRWPVARAVAFLSPCLARIVGDLNWRSAFQILQILVEEAIAPMKRTKSKGRPSGSSTNKAPVGKSRKRRSRSDGTAVAGKAGRRSASRPSAKSRARRTAAAKTRPTAADRTQPRERRSGPVPAEIAAPVTPPSAGPSPAEIAERAYHLYLDRGRIEGSPDADWYAAEVELWAERIAHH